MTFLLRYAALIWNLLYPPAQVILPFPGSVAVAASSCLTFYSADMFINMNSQTPGTTVTTANLATSTEAATTTWNSVTTHETFAASQNALPAGITANGTVHGCNYATQALAYDATTANVNSVKTIPGSHPIAVFSGWIGPMPTNLGGSGSLWNFVEIDQGVSPFASSFMQLQNGTNQSCGAYGMEIEYSGVTTNHSPCIAVSAGNTYFYTYKVDWTNLLSSLRMYTTSGTTFTQVGSEVTRVLGVTPTTTFTNGSAAITVSSGTGIAVGRTITTSNAGVTIPANTTIASGSGTSWTLSNTVTCSSCTGITVTIGIPGGAIGFAGYGNSNPGSQSGLTIYFQNIMIDWTGQVYPNLPH